MKLVGFVTRIPEQLDLHFYDFFYELLCIFKVHCFEFMHSLQTSPWNVFDSCHRVLGRRGEIGEAALTIPSEQARRRRVYGVDELEDL